MLLGHHSGSGGTYTSKHAPRGAAGAEGMAQSVAEGEPPFGQAEGSDQASWRKERELRREALKRRRQREKRLQARQAKEELERKARLDAHKDRKEAFVKYLRNQLTKPPLSQQREQRQRHHVRTAQPHLSREPAHAPPPYPRPHESGVRKEVLGYLGDPQRVSHAPHEPVRTRAGTHGTEGTSVDTGVDADAGVPAGGELVLQPVVGLSPSQCDSPSLLEQRAPRSTQDVPTRLVGEVQDPSDMPGPNDIDSLEDARKMMQQLRQENRIRKGNLNKQQSAKETGPRHSTRRGAESARASGQADMDKAWTQTMQHRPSSLFQSLDLSISRRQSRALNRQAYDCDAAESCASPPSSPVIEMRGSQDDLMASCTGRRQAHVAPTTQGQAVRASTGAPDARHGDVRAATGARAVAHSDAHEVPTPGSGSQSNSTTTEYRKPHAHSQVPSSAASVYTTASGPAATGRPGPAPTRGSNASPASTSACVRGEPHAPGPILRGYAARQEASKAQRAASTRHAHAHAPRRRSTPADAKPVRHPARWGRGQETEQERRKRDMRERSKALAEQWRAKAKEQQMLAAEKAQPIHQPGSGASLPEYAVMVPPYTHVPMLPAEEHVQSHRGGLQGRWMMAERVGADHAGKGRPVEDMGEASLSRAEASLMASLARLDSKLQAVATTPSSARSASTAQTRALSLNASEAPTVVTGASSIALSAQAPNPSSSASTNTASKARTGASHHARMTPANQAQRIQAMKAYQPQFSRGPKQRAQPGATNKHAGCHTQLEASRADGVIKKTQHAHLLLQSPGP